MTLSRSEEMWADIILKQILSNLNVTVHRALESEGARSCCVMEPSAFLQAWPTSEDAGLEGETHRWVSPCYLVPGNSLEGRDSPVRLGWVSGAGRDCSASGPCQKVKLGGGMGLLVSKRVI